MKSVLSTAVIEKEDELLALLSELISAESVSGNERGAQTVIIHKLDTLGLDPDIWEPDPEALRSHDGYFETSSYTEVGYDDRPNVAVRIEGGDGPTVTIGGHADVVDVTESEWDYDPWSLTREGETLYGRGAADMKGGLAALLIVLEAVLQTDGKLGGDLIFQSVIEEEDGGVGGTLSALERGYVPDAAIIPEPFEIPNIGIASAGVMYFRIHVPGKSVHAAWGHQGVNAIGKAMKLYAALDELNVVRKATIDYPPAYRADPELKGNVTNLNLGTVSAGDWPSTLPSEAMFEGRIGWPPGESREEVRSQLEATISAVANDDPWLTKNPPTVEWFGWQAAPHEVSTDSKIAQIAKRNAEAVTGHSGKFVGGNAGMDERFFQLYYDVNAVTVGPKGANLHGANEHTMVSSLIETAETIAHTIVDVQDEFS